jgi:CcmD family protein
VKAIGRLLVTVIALVIGAGLAIAQPAAQGGGDGFEKVSQLPAVEQLPAAPLLTAAYAFIWVAMLVYVFLLWRRLAGVDRELAALRRSLEERR